MVCISKQLFKKKRDVMKKKLQLRICKYWDCGNEI